MGKRWEPPYAMETVSCTKCRWDSSNKSGWDACISRGQSEELVYIVLFFMRWVCKQLSECCVIWFNIGATCQFELKLWMQNNRVLGIFCGKEIDTVSTFHSNTSLLFLYNEIHFWLSIGTFLQPGNKYQSDGYRQYAIPPLIDSS